MNFLAHLALSGNNEDLLMGNFTGDFIKGKLTPLRTTGWSTEYRVGVELHRFIDSYTDAHPTVQRAKRLLTNVHPKVAGVALDIFFDYFLANHFSTFYPESLDEYAGKAYAIMLRNKVLIPTAMLPMVEAMIRHDWLTNYQTIPGIKRTFDGLARRFAFMAAIQGAENELLRNEILYEKAFIEFYPDLKTVAVEFIRNAV